MTGPETKAAARDLGVMSLADMQDYQRALSLFIKAGKLLEDGGFEITFSLTGRETLIWSPSILGVAQDEGVAQEEGVVIEPVAIEADAEIPPPLRRGDAPIFDAYLRRGEPKAETLADAGAAPAAPAPADPAPMPAADPVTTPHERVIGPDGLLRGPWLAEEEDQLRALHAQGKSFSAIARVLNRPATAVQFRARNVLKLKSAVTAARKKKGTGGGPSSAPVPPPGAGGGEVPVPARPEPADQCIGSPQGVSAAAVPGGDDIHNSGVAEAPQSVPASAAPRMAAPAGVPTPSAGAAPAPAARGLPPAAAPQGAADLTAEVPPSVVGDKRFGACPEDLRGEARWLWSELARLRADPLFDPELDFDLVDGLARGRKLAELALELDVDAAVAKARFALLSATIRDDRGRLTIDGQAALLLVVRRRMERACGVSA